MFLPSSVFKRKYSEKITILLDEYESKYQQEKFRTPLKAALKILEKKESQNEEMPKKILFCSHENGPSIVFVDADKKVFERVTTDIDGNFIERAWPSQRWDVYV